MDFDPPVYQPGVSIPAVAGVFVRFMLVVTLSLLTTSTHKAWSRWHQ